MDEQAEVDVNSSLRGNPAPAEENNAVEAQNVSQPIRSEAIEEDDPFKGINLAIPHIGEMIGKLREAKARGLSGNNLRLHVAEDLRTEAFISAEAQGEPYFNHAVKEFLEMNRVGCSPSSVLHNSRVVYRIIGTIWAEAQTNSVRRYNVV